MKLAKFNVVTDINELHKVSEKVNLDDSYEMKKVAVALLEAYAKLDGRLQGISAIQIGMPLCAILLRYKKGEEPRIAYNPEVIKTIGSRKSNEGCLSEGEQRYIVRRPLFVKVSYYTTAKQNIVRWLPYKKARIFMHEYDHTQGVLLQDKGVPVKDKLVLGKYKITSNGEVLKVK